MEEVLRRIDRNTEMPAELAPFGAETLRRITNTTSSGLSRTNPMRSDEGLTLGQQILGRYGGWKKSLEPIKKLLWNLLNELEAGKSEAEIFADISASGLGASKNENASARNWNETRSAARIKAALASAQRCAICKARLVLLHASDDHIQSRADGGHSGQDNAQLTHHYCNHGFKEYYASLKQPIPDIASPV